MLSENAQRLLDILGNGEVTVESARAAGVVGVVDAVGELVRDGHRVKGGFQYGRCFWRLRKGEDPPKMVSQSRLRDHGIRARNAVIKVCSDGQYRTSNQIAELIFDLTLTRSAVENYLRKMMELPAVYRVERKKNNGRMRDSRYEYKVTVIGKAPHLEQD